MTQGGQRHGEAAGAAARVDDVQPVPAGVGGPRREHATQHVPDHGRARGITPAQCLPACLPACLAAHSPASSRHDFNVVPRTDNYGWSRATAQDGGPGTAAPARRARNSFLTGFPSSVANF